MHGLLSSPIEKSTMLTRVSKWTERPGRARSTTMSQLCLKVCEKRRAYKKLAASYRIIPLTWNATTRNGTFP